MSEFQDRRYIRGFQDGLRFVRGVIKELMDAHPEHKNIDLAIVLVRIDDRLNRASPPVAPSPDEYAQGYDKGIRDTSTIISRKIIAFPGVVGLHEVWNEVQVLSQKSTPVHDEYSAAPDFDVKPNRFFGAVDQETGEERVLMHVETVGREVNIPVLQEVATIAGVRVSAGNIPAGCVVAVDGNKLYLVELGVNGGPKSVKPASFHDLIHAVSSVAPEGEKVHEQ